MYLGGVVGLMGNVGCIAALAYLPPVVVSVSQTLVPPVGTLLAVLAGVDKPPGPFTALGGSIMVAGVLLIAKATSSTQVRVDLNSKSETV
jgi:drug/metabolite transporter (DMT)-like permease